jgi:hypothetical protein
MNFIAVEHFLNVNFIYFMWYFDYLAERLKIILRKKILYARFIQYLSLLILKFYELQCDFSLK